MAKCLRCAVAVLAGTFAAAAAAEDAYYYVPIDSLKITEGGLPKAEGSPNWRIAQRSQLMTPCAVLDGPGEAFVAYGPRWEMRMRADYGRQGRIAVRVPAAREVTGRICLPKRDLTGMVEARFQIPASSADPGAKSAFFVMKREHYEQLLGQDLPGGAWFRHQVREAQKALNRAPGAVTPGQPAWRGARGRTGNLGETFELFTGGRAMSENLQLDRVLPAVGPGEETVPIDSIEGITVRQIDWKPLAEGKNPKLDPLASRVPADQHVVFFPTFTSALTMSDESRETGELIFQMAEPHSADGRVLARYQKQMCLTVTAVARLLGPKVARSVALTGSDPYFPTGTDVAVLFEAPDPAVLEQLVMAQVTMKAQKFPDAKPIRGEVAGLAYRGYRSADRSVCCYVARMKGLVVITNSPYQIQRLVDVAKGRAPSIASLDEYVFFRDRYPLGDNDETAFLFLSDATIRRWCGPRWRIATSRRTRDAAVMAEIQAAQLDRLARRKVEPGPIYTDLPLADGGKLTLGPEGVANSLLGTLEFMTPIGEMEMERVAKAEAQAYENWRRGYQRNWNWAFDPIGARLGVAKKRLSADLTVMPLIVGSDYRRWVRVTQGVELAPFDGDPHRALGHFIMSLDKDSEPVRQVGSFARMMYRDAGIDPFGWLGRYVEVYVDDGPVWQDLAKVDPDKRNEFLQKNLWRMPIAVRADVSSGLKLTAFLATLRAYIDQTVPGMTRWESLKYKDQPYVKISPTERAVGNDDDLKKAGLYYTVSGKSLVLTLSEDLLKRSIDRQIARDKAEAEGRERPAPKQPWLGKSVAFQADRKLIEVAGVLGRREYQVAMQMRAWGNIPILNEWKRRYPDQDPVKLHARFWQTELVCPGGGRYVWNDKWQTMESTVYGHPGQPKLGPPAPPAIQFVKAGSFGLTFENQGLRAKVSLER